MPKKVIKQNVKTKQVVTIKINQESRKKRGRPRKVKGLPRPVQWLIPGTVPAPVPHTTIIQQPATSTAATPQAPQTDYAPIINKLQDTISGRLNQIEEGVANMHLSNQEGLRGIREAQTIRTLLLAPPSNNEQFHSERAGLRSEVGRIESNKQTERTQSASPLVLRNNPMFRTGMAPPSAAPSESIPRTEVARSNSWPSTVHAQQMQEEQGSGSAVVGMQHAMDPARSPQQATVNEEPRQLVFATSPRPQRPDVDSHQRVLPASLRGAERAYARDVSDSPVRVPEQNQVQEPGTLPRIREEGPRALEDEAGPSHVVRQLPLHASPVGTQASQPILEPVATRRISQPEAGDQIETDFKDMSERIKGMRRETLLKRIDDAFDKEVFDDILNKVRKGYRMSNEEKIIFVNITSLYGLTGPGSDERRMMGQETANRAHAATSRLPRIEQSPQVEIKVPKKLAALQNFITRTYSGIFDEVTLPDFTNENLDELRMAVYNRLRDLEMNVERDPEVENLISRGRV